MREKLTVMEIFRNQENYSCKGYFNASPASPGIPQDVIQKNV